MEKHDECMSEINRNIVETRGNERAKRARRVNTRQLSETKWNAQRKKNAETCRARKKGERYDEPISSIRSKGVEGIAEVC